MNCCICTLLAGRMSHRENIISQHLWNKFDTWAHQFKHEVTQLRLCWTSSFQRSKEVNLAQVSRGPLCIVTGVFLTMAHWISRTVAETWPAQKHAQPDPTCWTHCKNSDQTEIRYMLYSSREMNGSRELRPKASVTVTLLGKCCFP